MRPRGLVTYATSKGAVISLTKGLAADHGRQGIRVNCIAPGPVYTPMVYAAGMSDEVRERRRRAATLTLEGTGWDVGYAALFLVSDEARYITGVVLPVDGGVLIN
jgi:NAD(P)-dependent dehydrogenase (short-subunit alcohol dehydrogenase family)